MRILSPTGLGNPIGSFDTPLDNTTGVAGAIPVTGWALDKVGVSKVQVWREPVGNEPVASNNLVFLGDAVQAAGTRPDVQALYPNMPFNDRAGWGYLLLTNFLPAVSPGRHYIGECLRQLRLDPNPEPLLRSQRWPHDTVNVDGVTLGHPTYNQNRSDIATLFPGLCNSNGAVGFLYIDTTKLTNGLHTIAWVAYDNQGRGDGIGSRYFTVQNTAGVGGAEALALASGRRGAAERQSRPYVIEVEELDRIELDLGATSSEPLPTGSTLKDGVFYWQLGPGFLGEYQFRFTRADGSSALVQVKVHPKSYDRH